MPGDRPGVDVYLLPAVVGGGLGDVEEVLAAGRRLEQAGFRVLLYRRPGAPMPASVDGPWGWPQVDTVRRLAPSAACALTVAPAWGVTTAPERPGPLGRPGAWSEEAADLERVYGTERTLHVSLEEFARTLSSVEETRERLREGGVAARSLGQRLRTASALGEVATFRAAFQRFRAFDRENVVHLFATFRRDRAFAREFPHAVQTGPLWPRAHPRRRGKAPRRERRWVWYASPASAERIAPSVLRGLAGADPPVRLYVRTPRPWATVPPTRACTVETRPVPDRLWRTTFRRAAVRIVTGSRTLLEALEVGGPFLYFNGVSGAGRRLRRHRPEKIAAFLELARSQGVAADVVRDLADFARARRVASVVGRVVRREGGWRTVRFPSETPDFAPPYDDAGELIVRLARALGREGGGATALVRAARSGSWA